MVEPALSPAGEDAITQFKNHLADPRLRIQIDDMVNAALRETLRLSADDRFPLSARVTGQNVAARLNEYEDAARLLRAQVTLLGRWAAPEHLPTVANAIARMADNCANHSGGALRCSSPCGGTPCPF